MTRSVEIPDETTFAALRAFDGKQGYSKLERMRAALEAALPYLAPAEPEELEITPQEAADYREQIKDTGWFAPESERDRLEVAEEKVRLLTEELRLARSAPAGDGGLREALEGLPDSWDAVPMHVVRGMLAAPAVPQPAGPSAAQELRKAADAIESVWEGVEESGQPYTPALAAGQLRVRAADLDAAVPQPVDREALRAAIEQAAVDVDLAKYFLPGATDRFVGAVLALLAGEQEQVESPE